MTLIIGSGVAAAAGPLLLPLYHAARRLGLKRRDFYYCSCMQF
jgi:hypothetical protein